MKQFLWALLCAALLLALAACGGAPAAAVPAGKSPETVSAPAETTARVELVVFAAASLTETMDRIIEVYKAVAPHVAVIPTYDSSGTLKTQIQEGADCDLFLSAAQKQMNQLDAAVDAEGGNTEGLDFVLRGTRTDLLENQVVLAVPEGNPAGIETFSDLASDRLTLLCIGNEDVPVGAYSLEILEHLGILSDLEASGRLTYGSNVKEVTSQVKEGTVDAGIIYATDAFSAGLTVVDRATADMCRRAVYPAAVLNTTRHEQEARDFLDYLRGDAAMEIFRSVGFAPAG